MQGPTFIGFLLFLFLSIPGLAMTEEQSDLIVGSATATRSAASIAPATASEATQPLEPDYAVVAADARKIADEIESRLIESHMEDAKAELSKNNPVEGYPKAHEAYVDMEEMISFCEASAGKAGKACRFKLKMKMNLNPGNTLGQLAKGSNPGQGMFGETGDGSSGSSGGSLPFGLYGPESFGDRSKATRKLGDKKAKSDHVPTEFELDPLSGSVEEISTSKNTGLEFSAEGEATILEEYRPLIDAYFKRLAQEE